MERGCLYLLVYTSPSLQRSLLYFENLYLSRFYHRHHPYLLFCRDSQVEFGWGVPVRYLLDYLRYL